MSVPVGGQGLARLVDDVVRLNLMSFEALAAAE
jgi:hypothetical protein